MPQAGPELRVVQPVPSPSRACSRPRRSGRALRRFGQAGRVPPGSRYHALAGGTPGTAPRSRPPASRTMRPRRAGHQAGRRPTTGARHGDGGTTPRSRRGSTTANARLKGRSPTLAGGAARASTPGVGHTGARVHPGGGRSAAAQKPAHDDNRGRRPPPRVAVPQATGDGSFGASGPSASACRHRIQLHPRRDHAGGCANGSRVRRWAALRERSGRGSTTAGTPRPHRPSRRAHGSAAPHSGRGPADSGCSAGQQPCGPAQAISHRTGGGACHGNSHEADSRTT